MSKERIIGVDSVTSALEKLCQFKVEVNLIISRINFFLDIHTKQLIHRICEKLLIKEPPVVGYYIKGEEEIKDNLTKGKAKFKLIEYDETNPEFPLKYLNMIKGVYPGLNYDFEKAMEAWFKKPEPPPAEFVDPRKWLEEQGFVEVIEKAEKEEKTEDIGELIPVIQKMLQQEEAIKKEETEEVDYKKLYLEIKEKYEELSKYVKDLIDSIQV